ncbi:DUF6069 family protein [Nocardia sp. NPDC050697]|uniref:DUF6069 family protein n=1 Tax=Nocardia sp. NPDC050697 TaxID=3155158 RepID=UPI0033E13658
MTTASTTPSRIPALSRPVAVLGPTIAAVVANLIIWGIAKAAGVNFEITDNGKVDAVPPGGIVFITAVPMLVGLTAAVLLAYRWPGILRVAEIVGSVLAVLTIGLTIAADFDVSSTIALALMHLTLIPAIVIGLEGLRRKLAEEGRAA